MPSFPRFRFHLSVAAVAGALCGAAHAGGEPLSLAGPDQPRAAAVRPAPGVEIQYELLNSTTAPSGPGRLEGSVSGAHGELRTSVMVDPGSGAGLRVERLDTAWQTQAPGLLQTVVVGDTFGSGGGWSRPVRFGGVRFGRGLALRPGFVAAPPGGVAGAALPSAHMPLTGGPGSETGAVASALPAPSAAVHQPPVAAPAALQAGATDYEIEAGRLRNGWATAEDRYGEGYAAAAWRAGLGAQLTAEARAEWTPSRTAAGLEMNRSFGAAGSVRAVLAQSGTAQQSGLRWGMGLVGNSEGAAWTLSWDGFDRGYTPLAATGDEADARARVQADATLALGRGISAGLAYTHQTTWQSEAAGVLGLSARFPVSAGSTLSMNYSLRAGTQPGWQAGLVLAVPLGDRL
jgi:outer membrane usher protein FimD/PapC